MSDRQSPQILQTSAAASTAFGLTIAGTKAFGRWSE
jgi:hypothetical protein